MCEKKIPISKKQISDLKKQINPIEIRLKNENRMQIRIESETNSLMKITLHKTDQHNIEMDRLKSVNKQELVNIENNIRVKLIHELDKIKHETLRRIEEKTPNLEEIYYRDLMYLKLKAIQDLKHIEFMQESLNEIKKQQEESDMELNFLKLKYLHYEKRIVYLEEKLEKTNEKYLNDIHELDIDIEHARRDLKFWLSSHKDLSDAKSVARKEIDSFYSYLYSKGLNFQFYNLRSGKKLRT